MGSNPASPICASVVELDQTPGLGVGRLLRLPHGYQAQLALRPSVLIWCRDVCNSCWNFYGLSAYQIDNYVEYYYLIL